MTNTTYSCDLCGVDVTNIVSHTLTMRRRNPAVAGTENLDVCKSCQDKLDAIIETKGWKTQ